MSRQHGGPVNIRQMTFVRKDHQAVPKCWASVTQWHSAISQKNGELESTATKTYKLTQLVCLLEPFTDTVMTYV
jgi:hypothetical protein